MRMVIQRVKSSSVVIDNKEKRSIGEGLLLLVGIEDADGEEDIDWMVSKVVQMRIFSDEADKMNLSLLDIGGDLLVISQFTLFASTKKGNRPSFIHAAKPDVAVPIYERLLQTFRERIQRDVKSGEFGADMKVELINDGPVTIIIDSKNRV